MELDVRAIDPGRAPQKGKDRGRSHGEWPAAPQRELNPHPDAPADRAKALVQRRVPHWLGIVYFQMVLQLLADPGSIRNRRNPELRDFPGRSNAGDHEQLRRPDRARGKQHLAFACEPPVLRVETGSEPARPATLEFDTENPCVRQHPQIRPPTGRVEVCMRAADPKAVPGRGLVATCTLLCLCVAVGVERETECFRSRDKMIGDLESYAAVRYTDRSGVSMMPVRTALLPFRAIEIGQAIRERPPRRDLPPRIEIFLLPAHIDKPADRRGPAEASSTRPVEPPATQVRFRFSPKAPVEAGVADGLEVSDRNPDPGVPVAPARFDQQDTCPRIRAQPVRRKRVNGDV